ncbi:MAG: TonB-dependent receptor [Bacteroidetes bacterium]|nr:TonB-dependent receptor [Bacteroidota bacterium]
MKIIMVILYISVIQVFASPSNAQNVNLNVSNKSVREILKTIEGQAHCRFFYNDSFSDLDNVVSIELNNKTVKESLDKLLSSSKISYKALENNLYVIAPMRELMQLKVSGQVISAKDNLPVPGVKIIEKGTKNITVSDFNGNFSLKVSSSDAVLVFSSIGYSPQEVKVGSQLNMIVKMTDDVRTLEDVVVIGYGTVKKRDVSTSISSVSAKDLKDVVVSNFSQAISGKMAGVKVSTTNAAPGGGSTISIRGVGSINANTSPLFVVDGFPMKDGFDKFQSPLNSINPDDIESIEVLKDASSSAIYGTRAANGVILISTKRGKTGKPTINISMNTGVQEMINKVNVLDRTDFLKYMDDARAQSYINEDPNLGTNNPNAALWKWSDSPATRIANWTKYSQFASTMAIPGSLYYRWITVSDTCKNSPYNTNWQNVITRPGKLTDVNVSASGGTENVNYMISGGYFSQDGIVPTSNYNRFSFRANVDVKINDRIKLGLNLAPSFENIGVLSNTEGGNTSNPFYNALTMPPIWAPTDSNGQPIYYGTNTGGPWDWNMTMGVNPLSQFQKQDKRRTAKNITSLFADIKLLKDLTFRSEFNNQFSYWEQNTYIPSTVPTASLTYSRTQGTNNLTTMLYWSSQNFLTYKKTIGKHDITAMAGYTVDKTENRGDYINKYDFASDAITTLNQATTILNAQGDAQTNRSSETMIGSYARMMYNYAGKYYVTASVRRDGSSKFGEDKKWGVFPSLSLAWRVSDEKFFAPLKKYITDMKIRGGWGKIGNSGITNYLAQSTLSASTYVLGNASTLSPAYDNGKIANAKLGWETTTDWTIGSDFQFLDNRISLGVDYFYRKTTDMLFNLPLPTITGFSSTWANIGAMRNRGFEWEITTRNLTGAFTWTTDANLYYYRNRVLNIGTDKRPLINNNCYTSEGRPLADLYGMVDLGAYKDWQDVKNNPIFNASNPLWKNRSIPGSPKAADVNGDGILDSSDQTVIGSSIPDYTWGMTNTFAYKGFDLSIKVRGTKGGDISMAEFQSVFGRGAGLINTTYDYYNNYWTPTRTDGKYAAPTRKSYEGSDLSGTLLYKGTFVDVENVVLGYAVPSFIAKKLNVKNIRIYLSIQNALFITKYPGFNPETNYQGASSLSQGIDRGAYPLARTTSFGINLTL